MFRVLTEGKKLGIAATLQAQYATFITLAGRTAAVDAELQKIKTVYTQLWRAKTGSVRDPFGDVVKSNDKSGDFGLSRLNVR
jgi:nucleoporin p58/p45